MIARTLDATRLNIIANHPEVRPWIGGEGPVDLTEAIGNPANYAIEGDHGGWLLHPHGQGTYQIHSMFLPEGRGKPFFAGARQMLRYMFTRTDCIEIVTQCPDDNPAARMAATMMGFREWFRREGVWKPGTDDECGISYQTLTIDQWAMRDGEALKAGRAFHEALEAAKKAAGLTLPDHPEDPAHDRMAGAAWLMVNEGLTAKGVGFYCRWCQFAGYRTIEVLGHQTIDIGDEVIEVRNGETRVLLTR